MKSGTARQRKLLEAYLEELMVAGKAFRECCLNRQPTQQQAHVKEEEEEEEEEDEFAAFASQRRSLSRSEKADGTERPLERTRGKKLGPWYDLWVSEDPANTLERWRSMREGERSRERNRIHLMHPHLQRQTRSTNNSQDGALDMKPHHALLDNSLVDDNAALSALSPPAPETDNNAATL